MLRKTPILRSLSIAAAFVLSQCERPSPDSSISAPEPQGGESSTAPPAKPALPEEVSFNEHVQPILSEYCYHCHGPDEGTRAPKDNPLRLDLVEHAFEPRENGKPVMIKGDAAASYLVKLLHSKDQDTIMPPPESHKKLAPEKIAVLEKWIDQGAEYQDHWSFIPIERPKLPESGKEWSSHPIDSFIFDKLLENGLEPNPEQDPKRFYRRLHLDSSGLPPTPEDLAGVNWDKLEGEVDRLLASSASAELFSRYWLDAARYADTHGIHIDNYRAIWPYRDWVIEAFKQNMPWDQFTIEQIAGDLLPEPTLEQRIATGFNRCLASTGEGGAIA